MAANEKIPRRRPATIRPGLEEHESAALVRRPGTPRGVFGGRAGHQREFVHGSGLTGGECDRGVLHSGRCANFLCVTGRPRQRTEPAIGTENSTPGPAAAERRAQLHDISSSWRLDLSSFAGGFAIAPRRLWRIHAARFIVSGMTRFTFYEKKRVLCDSLLSWVTIMRHVRHDSNCLKSSDRSSRRPWSVNESIDWLIDWLIDCVVPRTLCVWSLSKCEQSLIFC